MTEPSPPFQIVLTTVGSVEEGTALARSLVDLGLAACVNVVPRVRSIYRWEGKIEDSEEVLLLIKSRTSLFERIREAIRELHAYDVPEIVALPIREGDRDYLEWVGNSVE